MKGERIPTLFNYRTNGVTVCAIWKWKKRDEPVSPIYWRVTYKGVQKYYFTGLCYSFDEWGEFVNRSLLKHKDNKSALEDYFDNVLRKSIDGLMGRGAFSFDALNVLLDKGDSTSVVAAFKARIERFEDAGRIRQSDIHRDTLRALFRFKHYSKLNKKEKAEFVDKYNANKYVSVGKNKLIIEDQEILFDEITSGFLDSWERFLQETGARNSTISIYMRTLRSVINQEDERGTPYLSGVKYPFGAENGGYVIPESDRKQLAIPIESIWKIEDFKTDNLKLDYARAVIVFLFYASGLNFGDFCRLKYKNIDPDTNELVIIRKKTNRANSKSTPPSIYIPLIPPLIQIINNYGNKDLSGYIFPVLNGVKGERAITKKISEELETNVNGPLKAISKILGIKGISTSTVRNSYMTHLETKLMYNTSVTKQMVGHKIKDVTAGYVNLDPKIRREINEKLLNPKMDYSNIIYGVVKIYKDGTIQ